MDALLGFQKRVVVIVGPKVGRSNNGMFYSSAELATCAVNKLTVSGDSARGDDRVQAGGEECSSLLNDPKAVSVSDDALRSRWLSAHGSAAPEIKGRRGSKLTRACNIVRMEFEVIEMGQKSVSGLRA